MKNFKKDSGITLIALIITIVIMLILAIVTIAAVKGEGIIGKAKQAKADYQNAQTEEQGIIDKYLAEMGNLAGNNTSNILPEGENGETTITWTDNGDGSFTSSYGITVAIGDKVAYDEGSGKTSSIDSNFVMKDMEWRILDIEEDGTIELISTQPTDSILFLSGEEDWLKGEIKLDTLCNDLYANGTGVEARSLKVEDIDKLAGIQTYEDKKTVTLSGEYGILRRYKYNPTVGRIQCSISDDKGNTWSDYYNENYSKFKYPGEEEINSTNYQDSNGNPIVKELEYTHYFYTIADRVTQETTDKIRMSSLITQGLNQTNDAVSNSYKSQWISSRCVYFDQEHVSSNMRFVDQGKIASVELASYTYNSTSYGDFAVRPVVSIPSKVQLTKVDGVWQVNI